MKFKLKATKEIIIAGKTIMCCLKIKSGNHKGKRRAKINITPEAVQKNNDRLALRKLTAILNANFRGGHLHVVLTYKNQADYETAKKTFDKFTRKLRSLMKENEEELRYVHVIECEHKRLHHHVVINATNIELIEKAWEHGLVKASALDSSGEYSKLAAYLLKETQKTFRSGKNPYKKRYTTSANIIKPEIKRVDIDPEELLDDPVPLKGYYIPKDLCRRYEHPVTGIEHMEYTMVALGKPIEYKVWPFGDTISGKEYYKPNYFEEQLII